MAQTPAAEQAYGEQDEKGDDEQQHGDRCSVRDPIAFDLPEDVHRSDLRLERNVAGYKDDRTELAYGAGETQSRTGKDGGQQIGQDDPPEGREFACPERGSRLFHVAVQL